MKKLVCPSCGQSNSFYAHQVCRLDVIVASDGEWRDNATENIADSIYESETPYGPYTCTECNHEFDIE